MARSRGPYAASKMTAEAIKTGYLKKRGGSIKTWKNRFFVLVGTALFYYKKESDGEPLGVIEFEPKNVSRVKDRRECKKKHVMKIMTKARVWYIRANSEEKINTWVETIRSIGQKKPDDLHPLLSEAKLKGFMLKQSKKDENNWKRRYFVFVDDNLSYFRDPKDSEPANTISLSLDNNPSVYRADEETGRKFALKIVTLDRSMAIASESPNASDIELWLEILSSVTNNNNSQNNFQNINENNLNHNNDNNNNNENNNENNNNNNNNDDNNLNQKEIGASDSSNRPTSNISGAHHQDLNPNSNQSNPSNRHNSVASTPRNHRRHHQRGQSILHGGGEVLMEGWLTKEGGSVKSWKRRYFVLRGTSLTYYREEVDRQHRSEPIGVIDVLGRIISRCARKDVQQEHCFCVETPWRKFYMAAGSAEEADRWAGMLKDVSRTSTAELLQTSDYSGWLTKQGGSVKTWKRRFCILKNSTLFYYKTQDDAEPKGSLELSGHRVHMLNEVEAQTEVEKRNVIKVETESRTWYLYSDQVDEIRAWDVVLRRAATCLAGRTLIVSARGGQGQFTSVDAAMAHAKTGDKIVVHPGRYRSRIDIDRAVIIEGMGEVILEASKESTIVFTAPTASLVNLTIRNVDAEDISCVDVRFGNAVLESCTITSQGGNGISAETNGHVWMTASKVASCGQYGLYFSGNSQCYMNTSAVLDNEWDGIMFMGKVMAHIQDSTVSNNMYNGICVSTRCHVVIEHCQVSGNDWDGISVSTNDGRPTIYDNQITGNKGHGLYFSNSKAQRHVVDNEIKDNGQQ